MVWGLILSRYAASSSAGVHRYHAMHPETTGLVHIDEAGPDALLVLAAELHSTIKCANAVRATHLRAIHRLQTCSASTSPSLALRDRMVTYSGPSFASGPRQVHSNQSTGP